MRQSEESNEIGEKNREYCGGEEGKSDEFRMVAIAKSTCNVASHESGGGEKLNQSEDGHIVIIESEKSNFFEISVGRDSFFELNPASEADSTDYEFN